MSQNKNQKNANPSAPAADSDWLSRQDDLMAAEQVHTSVDAAESEPEQQKPKAAAPVDRPDYVEEGLAEAEGSAAAPKGESEVSTEPPVDKNWLTRQDKVLERSGGSDADSDDLAS